MNTNFLHRRWFFSLNLFALSDYVFFFIPANCQNKIKIVCINNNNNIYCIYKNPLWIVHTQQIYKIFNDSDAYSNISNSHTVWSHVGCRKSISGNFTIFYYFFYVYLNFNFLHPFLYVAPWLSMWCIFWITHMLNLKKKNWMEIKENTIKQVLKIAKFSFFFTHNTANFSSIQVRPYGDVFFSSNFIFSRFKILFFLDGLYNIIRIEDVCYVL